MSVTKAHVNLQYEQHSLRDYPAKTLFPVFPTLPHICKVSTELVLWTSGASELRGRAPGVSA